MDCAYFREECGWNILISLLPGQGEQAGKDQLLRGSMILKFGNLDLLVLVRNSTDTTAGCRVNIKLDNELGSGRCIRRLIMGLVLDEWK